MPRPTREKHPGSHGRTKVRPRPKARKKTVKPKPKHRSDHGPAGNPKLVCVEWEDHCTRTGWLDQEEVSDKPMLVCSAGILVKENSKTLQITHARIAFKNYKPDVDCPLTIIKSCIVRRRNMKWPFA